MKLSDGDYALVEEELGRPPNRVEEALFVNLWSEHCAYRSSRPALAELPTESDRVVIGPGDDAAVVEFDDDHVLAVGIESHNHPSYVDPYDGAATGVGGIVRDILSMGARPVALLDSIYFGGFERDKTRYLFEGVVEGIGDYGNSIGVPTVGGQTYFDESYNGNPLVNVACVGIAREDEILTAEIQEEGNVLVLVGNASGRDGLGGASFASEDLSEDAESEDRPAVQVGDPYTEKLLIDATLEIRHHVESARDLGAAGLSGASSEMAAKGGKGVRLELDAVHLREPLNALEILLSESQERMLFEVKPENVERVREIAERYDLESSVIGEVTDDRFVAEHEGEEVVSLPADFLADGAPVHDLEREKPDEREPATRYDATREGVLDALADPNNASKEWVYRQYDHEVQTRTVVKPGDDSAVLDIDGRGLALSAGCDSARVSARPYEGGYETVVENVANLASNGARPLTLVNCLNFGNPERAEIYGEFRDAVEGMGDAARDLDVPIVGGNVSLYNESEEFGTAVNPTPTVAVLGVAESPDAPRAKLDAGADASLLLLDASDEPSALTEMADDIAAYAEAAHDVSTGGIAVTLAEMVGESGVRATVSKDALFDATPGRVVVAGDASEFDGTYETERIGETTDNATLTLETGGRSIELTRDEIEEARSSLEDAM
ncbi:MAG: phosphoribosylformylglycinamidine synthase subunit PurL [Halobacteriales archaeon]|nr:phosphoribosylformylglycinamidine synthase subunit PurL [Halobacteriales archaeon]